MRISLTIHKPKAGPYLQKKCAYTVNCRFNKGTDNLYLLYRQIGIIRGESLQRLLFWSDSGLGSDSVL